MYRTMTAATIVLLFVASTATAQTKLEFKYTEGSRSITNVESKTHQILTIAGMDIETKSEQFIVMSIEVGKRGEDGTLRLKQKFDRMQTNLNLPGGLELQFDSGNPDKKADNEQLEIHENNTGLCGQVLIPWQYSVLIIHLYHEIKDAWNEEEWKERGEHS